MATQSASRVTSTLRELCSIQPYKRTQGRRMRWLSFWGIVLLTVWGLWELQTQLEESRPADWDRGWWLWISSGVPLALGMLVAWVTYRIVWGWPRFADFLIATEAEMAKVSWSKRPELVQATGVVMALLVIMALYLFTVDMIWSWFLEKIGVLPGKPEAVAIIRPLADGLSSGWGGLEMWWGPGPAG